MVLVSKADEKVPGKKQRRQYEGIRRTVLRQLLHQEDVDARDVAKTGGKVEPWISETDDALREMLSHGFHKNTLKLKKGELSKVFQIDNDFYIVMVRQREAAKNKTFQAVRNKARADLEASRHEKLTYKMETALLKQAKVKIYNYTIINMVKADKSTG